MIIKGINDIIVEIGHKYYKRWPFIKNNKVEADGTIRIRDIGDLYLLKDIEDSNLMLKRIMNIKTNVHSFRINYLFPLDNANIPTLLEQISKTESKYKLVIIYILLYILTFGLYKFTSEENYKLENKKKHDYIEKLLKKIDNGDKKGKGNKFGQLIYKVLNDEFNDGYVHIHNIVIYMQLIYLSLKEAQFRSKRLEELLPAIILSDSYLSKDDYNIFIITTDIIRYIIDISTNEKAIGVIVERLSKSELCRLNPLHTNYIDENKQSVYSRVSSSLEQLITKLVENGYNKLVLSIMANIDFILIRDLLSSLSRTTLHSKADGKTLYAHMNYLIKAKEVITK